MRTNGSPRHPEALKGPKDLVFKTGFFGLRPQNDGKKGLVVWLVIGLVLTHPAMTLPAHAEGAAEELQARFIEVAKKVGPSVVSISTEVVQRAPAVQRRRFGSGSPFSEFDEELFDQFFKDFFGDQPEREFHGRGLGTGVIIDEGGLILTNEHVVHGAEKVAVTLPDGREFKGEIKGTDLRSDLAVIKIDAKDPLPAAALGDSDQVMSGQWAIAVGNPFGWAVGGSEPTLTVGVISALHRSLRLGGAERDYSDLIQTDAAINPGNSGGPLVNLAGEVIGINVAIFSTTGGYQGIGFAIPVNVAKRIVGDLSQGKKVLYGWLGINIQDVSEELQKHFGLSSQDGVIVAQVLPGSPAQKGGLQDGDVITGYDGQPVKNVQDLLKRVSRTQVGQKAGVKVIREGKEMGLTLEIAERPSGMETGEPGEGKWRGLDVSSITPEMADQYRLESAEGVVIVQVEEGSPADQAGLQPGELLTEINRRRIKGVKDFLEMTRQARGDALVKTSRGYFVLREGK